MANNRERIHQYLHSIFPQGATNAEIAQATGIHPNQQVFMLTRALMNEQKIRGVQGRTGEREWTFYAPPPGGGPPPAPRRRSMSPMRTVKTRPAPRRSRNRRAKS